MGKKQAHAIRDILDISSILKKANIGCKANIGKALRKENKYIEPVKTVLYLAVRKTQNNANNDAINIPENHRKRVINTSWNSKPIVALP
jgi:hypothetical protein